MLALPVTLTISAGAALVNLWLMVRCGQARGKSGVFVGDGGNEFLTRRMRAQANFVENAPFVLILIAALEATGGTNNWVLTTPNTATNFIDTDRIFFDDSARNADLAREHVATGHVPHGVSNP